MPPVLRPSVAPGGAPAPTSLFASLPPRAPAASPAATPAPVVPHYVHLGPWEQAQVDRLVGELASARQLIAAGKLASAHMLLSRARREADVAQRKLLVLPLYAEWTDPRMQLDDLDQQIASAWAKGPDPESRAAADAARRRVDALLVPLERGVLHLPKPVVKAQVQTVRAALDQAGLEPLLRENPAWHGPEMELERRLEHVEQLEALREGQAVLVDEIAHMAELDDSARAKIAHEDYDGALSDYAALEEACLAFKQDLAALQAQGFNPANIRMDGPDGDRQGRNFLARVDHWLLDARRRAEIVDEARDPWRRGLTGDRLRLYGIYGMAPTWPGAPAHPTIADALAQDVWIFYELPPGDARIRIRHEYHFVRDKLQYHEMFREVSP